MFLPEMCFQIQGQKGPGRFSKISRDSDSDHLLTLKITLFHPGLGSTKEHIRGFFFQVQLVKCFQVAQKALFKRVRVQDGSYFILIASLISEL